MMLLTRSLAALALIVTPVQYGRQQQNPYGSGAVYGSSPQAGASPCQATMSSPEVQVTAEREEPTYSRAENIESLTKKSAGSYQPEGVSGPSWHTQGLTQSMFVYKQHIPYQVFTSSTGLTCIRIQQIDFQVILKPQVFVANEFPPGSCMYEAVNGHEMKHVNVDRIVTDRHLPQIRAALVQMSENRAWFGPADGPQVQAQFEQFEAQLKDVVADQIENMTAEERRAQQEVDTLQEYRRVAALCPGQH